MAIFNSYVGYNHDMVYVYIYMYIPDMVKLLSMFVYGYTAHVGCSGI
jgi:hypothetical protein